MTEALRPLKPDLLAGIELRGFLVAAPVAILLGCGFVMIRKKGKLPGKTIPHTYDLEYGSDTVEIQSDAIEAGQRVVVIDDLLATGGTAAAAVRLCRMVGANVVGSAFIIELTGLQGPQAPRRAGYVAAGLRVLATSLPAITTTTATTTSRMVASALI